MPSKTIVYIYPDIVFATSFIMNLLILWGTSRLARLGVRKHRLLLGSITGALYSALASYPHLGFLHLFSVKMIFGMAMFLCTFFPLSFRRFLSGLSYFFLVSFSIGGIFFGVIFLIGSSAWGLEAGRRVMEIVENHFSLGMVVTVLLIIGLVKFGLPMFKKSRLHGVLKVPVKVVFDNNEIEVDALLDTGNQLQDPLFQTPVMVVEYNVISSYLPTEMRPFFEEDGSDFSQLAGAMTSNFWATRFRVVPFSSLGSTNGMLVGFRPDQIIVKRGEETFTKDNVIVGIYNKSLSPDGNYKALLHPDLLQEVSA